MVMKLEKERTSSWDSDLELDAVTNETGLSILAKEVNTFSIILGLAHHVNWNHFFSSKILLLSLPPFSPLLLSTLGSFEYAK